MAVLSDAEAIQESFDDPPQFALIFDRYYAEIFRYAERRVGYDQAADVASDVFADAFARRLGFDVERQSARPWLYGIAAKLTMKERRRFARQSGAMERLSRRRDVIDASTVPGAVFEAASQLADQLAAVRSALGRLDSVTHELLLMVAWDGLTYEQAAEALAIPVGTVRSRLARGRARLAAVVESTPAAHRPVAAPGRERR